MFQRLLIPLQTELYPIKDRQLEVRPIFSVGIYIKDGS